jgi:hypothetical protein
MQRHDPADGARRRDTTGRGTGGQSGFSPETARSTSSPPRQPPASHGNPSREPLRGAGDASADALAAIRRAKEADRRALLVLDNADETDRHRNRNRGEFKAVKANAPMGKAAALRGVGILRAALTAAVAAEVLPALLGGESPGDFALGDGDEVVEVERPDPHAA